MITATRPVTPALQKTALGVDAAVRKVAPALKPAHLAVWREQPVLFREPKAPWLLLPLDQDPYRAKDGGYPLPADALAELKAIEKAGIPFHRIAVAHELRPTPVLDRRLAKVGPEGLGVPPREAAKLLGDLPAAPELQKKAQALDSAVKQVLSVAATGILAVAAAPLGMVDPIVFGVVLLEDHEEPLALYYPLVAWEW